MPGNGTKPTLLPMSPLETLSFLCGKFVVQVPPMAETPKDACSAARHKLNLFQKQNDTNPIQPSPNDAAGGSVFLNVRVPEIGEAERGPSLGQGAQC